MGMSGIEQLTLLSSAFQGYFGLFGPGARDINRMMQTASENAKLDASISGFLRYVQHSRACDN
jgi:hypothetical protein